MTGLDKVLTRWKEIGSAGVFLLGIAFTIDARYAKDYDLMLVVSRLDYKILNDQHKSIQQRLWGLEDRYGKECRNADAKIREECRALLQQLQEMERELKQIEKK